MSAPIATYTIRTSGLWSTRHVVTGEAGELGVLEVCRNRAHVVVSGTYAPAKGEVLHFRRDPGLLRSQFSLWTDHREWLGSSLRWSFLRREISLATGSRPYRLLPLPGFARGWRLVAPKTGEVARIRPLLFRRTSRIEVFRKVDFELMLFSYFLGWQLLPESIWPCRVVELEDEGVAVGSGA